MVYLVRVSSMHRFRPVVVMMARILILKIISL
jgi:hypothetical protein